jgi:hypothetical protein
MGGARLPFKGATGGNNTFSGSNWGQGYTFRERLGARISIYRTTRARIPFKEVTGAKLLFEESTRDKSTFDGATGGKVIF